jgi:ribosomal protein S18 acetylase RimI-like enzyme
MTPAFAVRLMRPGELELSLEWARQEGWNPGLDDALAFHAADPSGFFVGVIGGVPVGCISVVKYGENSAFLGLYMVNPDYRGKGYGKKLWDVAMASVEGRVVGLDGVPAQEENYRRSGFEVAYRTIRYGGRPDVAFKSEPNGKTAFGIAPHRLDGVVRYDADIFSAPRQAFLSSWLTGPASRKSALLHTSGRIRGYGTIRRCFEGHKIGPLFANSPGSAQLVLESLFAASAGESVTLDVPAANPAGVRLAESFGLKPVFETARMYRGTAPTLPMRRIFGVTTLELG